MIKVNGVQVDLKGRTLEAYLLDEKYNISRVAVECDGSIVPKSRYASFMPEDGAELEIVSFVGGG